MSLHLAAQHLQSQGRGEDTHLVHMTTGELNALQKLAEAHGGSLTVNPKTGLPEAGFLSSILAPVAGIALGAITGDPLLAAGIVGGADAMITGSLGQGLMAGFGAWGGANLGTDIQGINATSDLNAVNTAQDTATSDWMNAQNSAIQAGTTLDPSQYIAQNFSNLPADQMANLQTQLASSAVANDPAAQANIIRAAGAMQASQNITPWSSLVSGASTLTSPSGITNFLKTPGVAWDAAKVALPIGLSAYQEFNKPSTTNPALVTSTDTANPMGLKVNLPNFQPTLPTPPSPAYQATYANYAASPYNPYAAKSGGLMDIHKYDEGGDADIGEIASEEDAEEENQTPVVMKQTSNKNLYNAEKQAIDDINKGATIASQRAKQAPAETTSHIYVDTDPSTRNLPADKAGLYMLTSNAAMAHMSPKTVAKGIAQTQGLGNIKTGDVMDVEDPNNPMYSSPDPIPYGTSIGAAHGGMMGLPAYNLGGYSDGGRLLKGPGDGVSDSIPATIGHKQPARLAEGEFVIPARIVSELGNGSTDAGAKRLYDMMDRIKAKRAKAKDIAADTKAYKLLPA